MLCGACGGYVEEVVPNPSLGQEIETLDPRVAELAFGRHYIILPVEFPDGSAHQMVHLPEYLPTLLYNQGLLSGPQPSVGSPLKIEQARGLIGKPIKLQKRMVLTIDSAPNEPCAIGGFVEPSAADLWASSENVTLDTILSQFFLEKRIDSPTVSVIYHVKDQYAVRITCADIAKLIQLGARVARTDTMSRIVVYPP